MAERNRARPGGTVIVIGLGRFGLAVARTLMSQGVEVIGVDSSARIVADHAAELNDAYEADTTNRAVLDQLGVMEADTCVVAIGTNLEASILTSSALIDMGHPSVWAKATSRDHGRILERLGVHHVVLPEHDMGVRVAHAMTGGIVDWFEVERDFVLAETHPPRWLVGRTLAQSNLRADHGVTVVAVKHEGGQFSHAEATTEIHDGDLLVIAGPTRQVERFSGQA